MSDVLCKANETVNETSTMWNATFEIFCDDFGNETQKLESKDFTLTEDNLTCQVLVIARHNAGCPVFQGNGIVKFLEEDSIIMGVLLIIFGITACFFGAKLLPQVASVFAFCFTFSLMITVSSLLGGFKAFEEHEESEEDHNAVVAIVCTVFSIIMSFYISHIVRKHHRIAPFLLGVTVGVVLGLIINSLVFEEIIEFESTIVKILVVSVFALIVSIGTAKYCKTLVAPMTSFIGSYSITRGLSMFLGGFPQ